MATDSTEFEKSIRIPFQKDGFDDVQMCIRDRENRESESARAYGRYQNVFLTGEELADLQASFPTVWGQYIEKLSEYMASTKNSKDRMS